MLKVWKPYLFIGQFNYFLLKLELVFCFKIWFNFLFIYYFLFYVFFAVNICLFCVLVVSDADIEQFQRTRRDIISVQEK